MMPLYFLSEIQKYCKICKKKNEILVQTALLMGRIWRNLKITPESTLLSFTMLYNT